MLPTHAPMANPRALPEWLRNQSYQCDIAGQNMSGTRPVGNLPY